MRKKQIIITLIAALTIVLTIGFVMVQMGSNAKGGRPGGPPSADVSGAKPNKANANKMPREVSEGPQGMKSTGGAPQNEPSAKARPDKLNQGRERPNRAKAGNDTTSQVAQIGVVAVSKQTYNAKVKGYGVVQPKYSLSFVSQVSGQIVSISEQFETGRTITQGQSLAVIDPTDYNAALASAQANYDAALVALEEERLQGQQAQDEWARSGLDGEPDSPLVHRGPQLTSAKSALKEAQENLAQAKRDLAASKLAVPFNSLVVSREVSPGSIVQVGGEVATLFSTDTAEIAVALSPSQWLQLPTVSADGIINWAVTLTDTSNTRSWQGHVERIEQHQDETTRQRNAVVVIEHPLEHTSPLHFGSFVTAIIEGRELNDVWRIPSSAISQQQEVWYVDNTTSQLAKFTPTVLFEYEGYAYIRPYAEFDDALIVKRPLSSYLENTPVNPVVEGGGL